MTRDRHRHTLDSLSIARQSRDDFGTPTAEFRSLVAALADRLKAPPNVSADAVKVAGLTDLGMLGVNQFTLSAARPLNDRERDEINRAPLVAQSLVASMPGYETVADAVRHAHERWDGKGYPDGLVGIDIPLASRIVAVAAAYRAMSTSRPFRSAMQPRAIAAELRAGAGTQFDPEVVAAMLGLVDNT